ncbi:MAG: hypothetical protein WBQ52_04985 [Terracidiphilus sp.]
MLGCRCGETPARCKKPFAFDSTQAICPPAAAAQELLAAPRINKSEGIKAMNTRIFRIALLGMGALSLAALPVFGDTPTEPLNQGYPEPGTLNYFQGLAYLDGSEINHKNMGSEELNPGEVLHTSMGKAEILLTPGVFLRLGDHSAVKMISPDIANTQVALLRGEAGVEVDQIHPQNDLQIIDNGVMTRLPQRGFYEFTASQPKVLVFSGKAEVETGDGQYKGVRKHHEMALVAGVDQKPHGFNANHAQDNLYNWSMLRSQYLAEENEQAANEYGWNYPGWYWNPMALGWDWGPWGWGGWGPWWGGGFGFWGGYPIYGGFYGGGDYRGGFRGGIGGGFHGGGGGGGRL